MDFPFCKKQFIYFNSGYNLGSSWYWAKLQILWILNDNPVWLASCNLWELDDSIEKHVYFSMICDFVLLTFWIFTKLICSECSHLIFFELRKKPVELLTILNLIFSSFHFLYTIESSITGELFECFFSDSLENFDKIDATYNYYWVNKSLEMETPEINKKSSKWIKILKRIKIL